jgi:hypothetical protein
MDLSDPNMVVEVNMWAKAKFKKNVASTDVLFAVADGIGFEQMMPGDIVVVDRVRNPEHMLITGFDETNQLVLVQRAYHGTIASDYVRGTAIRVFRILNGGASIGLSYQDLTQEDGSVLEHQLVTTTLNYDWQPNDTCLPGCFWLEFKLLQMTPIFGISTISVVDVPSIIDVPSIVNVPSVISVVPCGIGLDVEWVRRFPVEGEGFLIKIMDSPTSEM